MPTITENGYLTYYQAADGTSSLAASTWYLNSNKRHAVNIYSDFDGLEEDKEKIVPETSGSQLETLNTFDDANGKQIVFRTKRIDDNIAGKDIELDLGRRIITFLVDHSGSMSWNDNNGLRFAVTRRMINRIASTYPGDVGFNLIKYGGTPINVTLFAVVEGSDIVNSDDLQSINSAFFQEEESNFAGVRVVRRAGGFPQHPLDGDIVAEGFLSRVLSDDLEEGTKQFYKIFSFDKNFHFSKGVEVAATPRERDIPRGVARFESEVLVGTGTAKDNNVVGLWHLDEGKKRDAFDFSGSKVDLTISDDIPIWLDTAAIPMGSSGIRFDGTGTSISSSGTSKIAIDNELTISLWVYPYDINEIRALVGRQSASDANYLFYIDNDRLGFYNGSSLALSTSALKANQWQYVSVTVDYSSGEVRFFIDGDHLSTAMLSSIATNALDEMQIDIGFDRRGVVNAERFFGRITEVSVHNIIRDDIYIKDNSAITEDLDNGDRLVVLEFEIPSDFDYDGGNIRILKDAFSVPSWEEDGEVLLEQSATPGRFILTDVDNLVFGSTVSYRIFSQNSIGNYSLLSDSPNLSVDIPLLDDIEDAPPLTQAIAVPVNLTATKGNKKIYLKWTNFPNDSRIARVRVYYADNEFPVADENGNFSGEKIFEGLVTDVEFVHRGIPNAVSAFYSVVNVDKYGRPSVPANIGEIPSVDADDMGIPLLDIEEATYEIVDNSSVSIQWQSPIAFKSNLETFFGDRISIFASVTDEFGRPVSDNTQISMEITPSISRVSQADDVFGVTGIDTTFEDSETFQFGVTKITNGIIKGSLRMNLDTGLLSSIREASFNVQVTSSVPDTRSFLQEDGTYSVNLFEFFSDPISISFKNPFKVQLLNRDGRVVTRKCKKYLDDLGFSTLLQDTAIGFENVTKAGAYVRSTIPFVARLRVSFKDGPLPGENNVKVAVWDARDTICGFGGGDTSKFRESVVVTPPASKMPVQRGTEEVLSADGNPTTAGPVKGFSFVDIPLNVPQLPQGVELFVQSEFGGFIVTRSMFILFENILQIEVNAQAPVADGIDIAEQMATVYLIDPDDPENKAARTLPSDTTVARWGLIKKEFARDRSFFSQDNIPLPNGVFSFVRQGISRNVFFGPAVGVMFHTKLDTNLGIVKLVGERYKITAAVVFDGLSAESGQDIEIFPIDSSSRGAGRPKLLMEFPTFKNNLFADGESFLKLLISKDPNESTTRLSRCFRSCIADFDAEIVALNAGQFISIGTDNRVEILWGDITESIDPDTGAPMLVLGEDSFSGKGSANVELQDAETTPVYFRVNDFFPPSKKEDPGENTRSSFAGLLNPCKCLNIQSNIEQPYEFIVHGSTTVIVNNVEIPLTGGGEMVDGLPPTIILPKEPLEIEIVDIRVGGVSSNAFVMDGESVNEVIVEVKFANNPVPNATPVEISTLSEKGGKVSKITFSDSTIFTRTFLDETLDVEPRSYASLNLDPVSPEEEFSEYIIFVARFDRSGTVNRKVSTCAQVEWDPGNFDVQTKSITNIFSGDLERYDTVTDTWSSLASMTKSRGHVSMEFVDGELYVIGGIDSNTISKFNEVYSLDDNEWELRTNMPTPRFGAISTVVGTKIYVMGGVSVDSDVEDFIVSKATEVYDTVNDSWSLLTEMPTVDNGSLNGVEYGVCFGVSKIVNVNGEDRIYVLSGLTEVDRKGQVKRYNDRVLYYSVDNDKWVVTNTFTGVELAAYKRISPNVLVDGDNIVVVNGALQPEDVPASSDTGELVYLAESYAFNVKTETLDINDFTFSRFPRPRFRSASVTEGANHYFIGGSDEKSQTLKVVERISSNTLPFGFSELASITKGRSGFGAAAGTISAAPYSNIQNIFVAGGFTSGRGSGFLSIDATFSPSAARLDGKQTVGISVEISNDAAEVPPKDVRLIIRGFVRLLTETQETERVLAETTLSQQAETSQKTNIAQLENNLSVYPVLFSTDEIVTVGGRAVVTLLPRAEDLLQSIEDLQDQAQAAREGEESQSSAVDEPLLTIKTGRARESYQIIVQITVDDDTFYGQTVEDLAKDFRRFVDEPSLALAGLVPPPVDVTATAEDERGILPRTEDEEVIDESLSEAFCQDIVQIAVALKWSAFSKGISLDKAQTLQSSIRTFGPTQGATVFNMIPQALAQLSSPVVPYFSDIDWIPTVGNLLDTNDSTAAEALTLLKNLENSIPFGASALFDAIIEGSEVISDNDVDGIKKIMYVNTDNESNLSRFTIDEAIESVNAVEGIKETPVVMGLYSVVDPVTLSSKANISDTEDLNKIADLTGGQSATVLSPSFEDDVVKIFFGEAVGSMGYGLYEFVHDFGGVVSIERVTAFFRLFDNTNGTWQIATSNDNYNFTVLDDKFKANTQIAFENLRARYLRFTIILITGFSASNEAGSELIPLPASPALAHIELIVEKEKESFLFLNTETAKVSPQQVVLTANATDIDSGQIKVGVARGSSHNWLDYQSDVRPALDQSGKIFLPIRRTDDVDKQPREDLIRLDPYTYRMKHKRFSPECSVIVYDQNNKEIDSTGYKVFARNGLIVFNNSRNESLTAEIVPKEDFRVGFKFTNRSSTNPIEVFGLGYMYNTNVDLLPVPQNVPPRVLNVVLSPAQIDIFTLVTVSYDFSDPNFDDEVTELTEIRWFINDVRIPFLDDLRTWNDLNNSDDPLFRHAITDETAQLGSILAIQNEALTKDESILKTGDSLYFSVRASDGALFSDIIKSNIVNISETKPSLSSVSIKSRTASGTVASIIRGDREVFVDFEFAGAVDKNESEIAWFVNGEIFKTGKFGESEDVTVGDSDETVTLSADTLQPGEINAASTLALQFNNELSVTVTPQTGTSSGEAVGSDAAVVQNALPVVTDVLLGPTNPKATQSLTLTFTFSDYDINVAGNQDQSNQSKVKWLFKSNATGNIFREVTELANQSTVPSLFLVRHQQWRAEVTPSDSLDDSKAVESNTVTIL